MASKGFLPACLASGLRATSQTARWAQDVEASGPNSSGTFLLCQVACQSQSLQMPAGWPCAQWEGSHRSLEVDAQLRVMTARLGGGQAGTFTS